MLPFQYPSFTCNFTFYLYFANWQYTYITLIGKKKKKAAAASTVSGGFIFFTSQLILKDLTIFIPTYSTSTNTSTYCSFDYYTHEMALSMSPIISVTKSFIFVLLDLPAAFDNIYHVPLNNLLAFLTSHLLGFHLPPWVLLRLVCLLPQHWCYSGFCPGDPLFSHAIYTFSLELQPPS